MIKNASFVMDLDGDVSQMGEKRVTFSFFFFFRLSVVDSNGGKGMC